MPARGDAADSVFLSRGRALLEKYEVVLVEGADGLIHW